MSSTLVQGISSDYYYLSQIPYTWVMCTKPHLAYRALSHALTVGLYLFLLKPKVFHLEWI